MEHTPHYELPEKEGLSPKQQQIYFNLQTINSQIKNIDAYLNQGNYDQALHSFHIILDIYRKLNDQDIPFRGKEILHKKIKAVRDKIKERFGEP